MEYILRAEYKEWTKGRSKWTAPAVLSVLQAGYRPTYIECHRHQQEGFARVYVRFETDAECVDDLKMLLKLRDDAVLRPVTGEMAYPGPYYRHTPVRSIPVHLQRRYKIA